MFWSIITPIQFLCPSVSLLIFTKKPENSLMILKCCTSFYWSSTKKKCSEILKYLIEQNILVNRTEFLDLNAEMKLSCAYSTADGIWNQYIVKADANGTNGSSVSFLTQR